MISWNRSIKKYLRGCRGCCGPIPLRYVIVIMAAIGLGFVFILRNSFSLALTQMRIKPIINATKHTSTDDVCPLPTQETKETMTDVGEFHWTTADSQYLISAYFYGYVIAHIPGGILSDLLGAKNVLNGGLGLSGVASLLTPMSARFDYWMLFFIRVVMGLGHGVIFPGLSSLVAKWSPPTERSIMTSITYAGNPLGSAVGISLAGLILGSLPGWEPVFYIFGAAMLVWCVAFHFIGYSSPGEHPYIKDGEQNLIEESIGSQRMRPKSIPWIAILTSKATIAFVLVDCGHSWLIFFVGVQLPVYMKNVLHYNITESGITSALPYLAMWMAAMIVGFLSDWMIKNKKMSITNTRKLFTLMSNFLPVPFLIGASYAGCNKDVATGLFTMMMLFKGFAYPSLKANALDLSPNYAGVLMAIANGAGAAGGLVLPIIVGWFINEGEASVNDWRYTFFFSAVVMFILTLPYAFFGSGERQPFDDIKEVKETPTSAK